MGKSLVGIFKTSEETIEAIKELTYKGYSPKQISVLSKNNDLSFISNETNVEIQTSTSIESVEPTSFLDSMDNQQAEADGKATEYESELQKGKYLIFLDSSMVIEEQTVDHTSFDNNEVDVMPSQTMNTTFERKKVD
ncbi:general stress protein [Bacillus sp. B1-b2]|uniref:general stress protein n=1 Tax=Bacillus sp. B1-b2 TaxID=2653201 RepID=UPI001261CA40|nr:general stress protein [Bacillus sp. B1-b2]KAB7668063.1 hypothetical protein F9279_14115 [Bacillus sp. B1-b2]